MFYLKLLAGYETKLSKLTKSELSMHKIKRSFILFYKYNHILNDHTFYKFKINSITNYMVFYLII